LSGKSFGAISLFDGSLQRCTRASLSEREYLINEEVVQPHEMMEA
jgi:hypothetical protein